MTDYPWQKCRHCGVDIRYGLFGWVHRGTGSRGCDQSTTTRAQP